MFDHPMDAAAGLGPSLPPLELLGEFAPETAWRAAWHAATGTTVAKIKMGAVIFGDHGLVAGSSEHRSPVAARAGLASMHAEVAALVAGAAVDLRGTVCLVVGLNRRMDGCPWSCCPCGVCARALRARGVAEIRYPQRTRDGGWSVVVESVEALARRTPDPQTPAERDSMMFARESRIAHVDASILRG